MATIELIDNPADGTSNPGGHYHGAEMDNIVKAAGGFGVLLETYSMTVTGSDMVVTIPAFDAVVPDGSGGFKVVSKSSATNVTIAAADASDPRTDIIHVDSAGNVGKTDGTATTETGNVEEAPMPALASDEIMLAKVRVEDNVSVIATDKVVGRAIDISRHGFIIHKPSTETIDTSTTLQSDDDFTFPVASNGVYAVEMLLLMNSGTTPDFKYQWSLPASATLDGVGRADIASGLTVMSTVAEDAANLAPGSANDVPLFLIGVLQVSATAGTAVLQWAQNTSDGGNTSVLIGSWLHVRRIL